VTACSLAAVLLGAGAAEARAVAQRPSPAAAVAVGIDETRTGATIPGGFLGLSIDTPALAMPAMQPPFPALENLLEGLGPGLLRISGDEVDRTQWSPVPAPPAPWSRATVTPQDLANLATLASATGWRVLLGLDLGHPIAAALSEEARAATATLGASLAGLAIGNEPDLYSKPPAPLFGAALGRGALRPRGWGLGDYEAEVAQLQAAFATAGVSAPAYGPETATSRWFGGYAAANGAGTAVLTSHVYPLDRCAGLRVLRNGPSLASLLSARVTRNETRQIRQLARVAALHARPLRIDELGSVACAGRHGTSDTFGAALWAVNVALIAAREGVSGVNFTSGLGPCAAAGTVSSPWYSPICTAPDGQLTVRPQYYALLLLGTLEGSSLVPVTYRAPGGLAVFALRARDGTLRVVIDDMQIAAPGHRRRAVAPQAAIVTLQTRSPYAAASALRLTAASAAATAGTTLGGATVGLDGTLPPTSPEALAAGAGGYTLRVQPASVVLVTLSRATASRRDGSARISPPH